MGIVVGLLLGLGVGAGVGLSVGKAVGLLLGLALGAAVGLPVGETEGAAVVGDALGILQVRMRLWMNVNDALNRLDVTFGVTFHSPSRRWRRRFCGYARGPHRWRTRRGVRRRERGLHAR